MKTKNTNIPITLDNAVYAKMELDFTHDYSRVNKGSNFIDLYGNQYPITKIDKDECGRKQYWSGKTLLDIQYDEYHNMRTKRPFFAYEFKLKK